MLALWTNAFPKTVKEFDQEKTRGDAYTWHVTMECRAGALCCKYLHGIQFLQLGYHWKVKVQLDLNKIKFCFKALWSSVYRISTSSG